MSGNASGARRTQQIADRGLLYHMRHSIRRVIPADRSRERQRQQDLGAELAASNSKSRSITRHSILTVRKYLIINACSF
jgi:hypothetical protein